MSSPSTNQLVRPGNGGGLPGPDDAYAPGVLTDAFDRAKSIDRLANDTFDVLVIGGGLCGTAAALDAASRGLATALVEADDFGAGASARTSKLVLGTAELSPGRLAAAERLSELSVLRDNASHLVTDIPIIEPERRSMARDRRIDRLARRVGRSAETRPDEWEIDRAGVLDRIPTLRPTSSASTSIHTGAVVDDSRLSLARARTAALRFGARCANRVSVTTLRHDKTGHVIGADVIASAMRAGDLPTEFALSARTIIDATRPVSSSGDPGVERIFVAVPESRFVADSAFVSKDLTIVPWLEHVIFGVPNDTYTQAGPNSRPGREHVNAALAAAADIVDHGLTHIDVSGAWFGPATRRRTLIRPAGRTEPSVGDDGTIRAYTDSIASARRLAAAAVDVAIVQLGHEISIRPSRTRRLALIGSGDRSEVGGLSARHLWHRYGTEARVVQAIMRSHPDLALAATPETSYIVGEVVHAARYEMAGSIDDVLSRRWRVGLLDVAHANQLAPLVADLLGAELGWDAQTRTTELETFLSRGPAGALDAR